MNPLIPDARLNPTLARVGRVAAVLVLILAALAWVGWATGTVELTRIHPDWPPMKPWTALWLAALAVAILVQSGSPSPVRVWAGRGLAAAVALVTVGVLVEYATGWTFGIDGVWFEKAVRGLQPTSPPGRASPQTVSSALLLSVAVSLARLNRTGARKVWAVSLFAAMVLPFVTVLAYLFGAVDGLQIANSTGMALTTAVGLLLLGLALVLVQPAWLLAQSDRLSLIRLSMILAGFPLLIGLSRRAFLALGLREQLALTFAVAIATIGLGSSAYRLSRRENELSQTVASDRALLQASEARTRLLMDSAAVAMTVSGPDGRFVRVNAAMCDLFGYDAQALLDMTLQDLTAPTDRDADVANVEKLMAGQVDSYRVTNQYIHADGHPIWGDLAVSCLRRPNGDVDQLIGQIIDVTKEVHLARRLRFKADKITSELRSAAAYVASILPRDLDGPVRVSSRYLPSQQLAGDSFDYRWIDDDHLIVYLLDVSGHGISPALLSVSVHNLMRSGSLPLETLLAPEKVLAELNRLFQMDQHDGNYFTMWFGVYELSSRTLRYATAGAPPAIAVGSGTSPELLATDGQPLGMFDDVGYTSCSFAVPHGCRILLYSDGAFELDLIDGRQWTLPQFTTMFTEMAASSNLSLDELGETLQSLTRSGVFDDDCSLVLLKLD